jgi:hypothetical protein
MKIAWLLWDSEEDKEAGEPPRFVTQQPNSWECFIQIVYAEITK